MEIKKLSPQAYQLHNFVENNCIGEENAMQADVLCFTLGLENTRQLRKLRAEVNGPLAEFHKRILTSSKGYYVATGKDPLDAHKQYRQVAWRKIRQGLKLLNEGKILLQSINEDQSIRFNIGGHQKEIVEIFIRTDKSQEEKKEADSEWNPMSTSIIF